MRDRTRYYKRVKLILNSSDHRHRTKRASTCLKRWMTAVRDSREARWKDLLDNAAVEIEGLRKENMNLRRDNERFVRLIDSGEWGRGRVEELRKAGEVLKAERDALHSLVESLRQEYAAVEKAKAMQAEEMHQLKQKVVSGGSTSPAARNKMLVKGASSFNALVRALKQDLVDHKTGTRDPSLMLEVDKMSLDRVHVFPDGELKIEAVKKGEGDARTAFS